MKPSLLKELVAIANRLDQKGFGKEADVLDGIIKSAYPGEQCGRATRQQRYVILSEWR